VTEFSNWTPAPSRLFDWLLLFDVTAAMLIGT